ncbi:hypothetical protein E5C33_02820 [Stenotrophomonas maltophilia]|uniref:hypothetical protein n=1 Tax=Stenotrophomonas maltophilia TaxID=40324 RepID=UPI0010768597|nr:hypothetical protein [Stenotrophomonas maltophilia]TFZ47283.1 hypothetical protein E5C33_02820 [Stenotrophomonas maltophilia]
MMARLLFLLLWVASNASAQAPVPTPEQSFDLFARFMLEGDADADAQVAALIGMPVHTERWEDTVDRMVVGDAPVDNERTRAGRELAREVARALRQTHCRSTGSEPRDGDDIQIAIVSYACQVPDYEAMSKSTPDDAVRTPDDEGELATVHQAIAQLQRAPKRVHAGSVVMARLNADEVWVAQDMPPLHQWIALLLALPE